MLQRVIFRPDPLSEPPSLHAANQRWLAFFFTLSSAVHVSLGLALPSAEGLPPVPTHAATEVFDIDPPPVPPVLPDPPPPPTNNPRAQASPPASPNPHQSRSPPAEPAAAAAVLTAQADAAPLDLTDGFVTGHAAIFSGGVTTSRAATSQTRGNSSGPRAARAASSGPPSKHDQSRGASVVGGFAWSCPFPPAADNAGIDFAVVQLRVRVGTLGQLDEVSVLADPGYGFGGAARRCAAGKRFRAALDRNGLPVSSELVIRVRFTR